MYCVCCRFLTLIHWQPWNLHLKYHLLGHIRLFHSVLCIKQWLAVFSLLWLSKALGGHLKPLISLSLDNQETSYQSLKSSSQSTLPSIDSKACWIDFYNCRKHKAGPLSRTAIDEGKLQKEAKAEGRKTKVHVTRIWLACSRFMRWNAAKPAFGKSNGSWDSIFSYSSIVSSLSLRWVPMDGSSVSWLGFQPWLVQE